jgi:hypothetical protein
MKAFLRTGVLLLPALLLGLLPASSPAQIGLSVSINTAPPVLPVYAQPPCPQPGYLWEPGYWAWGPDGYYWVPGVWVEPPQPGLFWTPGYWAFENGDYMWNEGYWGPQVGFYGGVDYGFGYPGQGFYGGMWQGNVFRYNVVVWHVGGGFHDTYRAPVTWHAPWHTRASFNGGRGIPARPTPQEERAMHEHHYQPTPQQMQHRQMAARQPEYQYKTNHGHPQHAAMTRVSAAPARNQQRPAQNGRHNAHPASRPGTTHQPAAREEHAAPGARRATPERPRAESRPKSQAHPAPKPEKVHPARPESRPETHPRPQSETRPESRPETHPMPKPETRSAPRPESRPETRPARKPETRPAPRPESRPKSHPAARPESHPRPESRPKAPEKPHERG